MMELVRHFKIYLGKFTRVSADNYDEFLKALNVGFLLRKVGSSQKFGFHLQKGRRLSKVSVFSSER